MGGSDDAGITAAVDPDQVMRGSYLAKAYGCAGCHTPITPTGPDVSRAYAGRAVVPDLLGSWTSPNLTPSDTGIGSWTEAQVITAIRTGARPDGTVLDARMPSAAYGAMTNADVRAIAVFLRTLPPVDNRVPRLAHPATAQTQAQIATTVGTVAATVAVAHAQTTAGASASAGDAGMHPSADAGIALAAGPVDPVDDPVQHGRYLVTMMGCAGCHAQPAAAHVGERDPEAPRASSQSVSAGAAAPVLPVSPEMFAGGLQIALPLAGRGILYAPNITGDRATGIGAWTGAQIAGLLRTQNRPDGSAIQGPMRVFAAYWAELDDRDLAAVAAYMKTIPAVRNRVPKSTFVAFAGTDTPGMAASTIGGAPSGDPRLDLGNNGIPGDAGVVIPARLATPGTPPGITGGRGTPAFGGGGTPAAGNGGGTTATGATGTSGTSSVTSTAGVMTGTVPTATRSGASTAQAYGVQTGGSTGGAQGSGNRATQGAGTAGTTANQTGTTTSNGGASSGQASPGAGTSGAPSTAGTGTSSQSGGGAGGGGAGGTGGGK